MLLSDGTVMLQHGGNFATDTWFKLTPSATGSYTGGTFSSLASMSLPREFFTSAVLPSGKVFVLGGEFSGASNADNDINTGEIYDPVANSWSPIASFPQSRFGDAPSEVLPDGTILAGYIDGPETYIYNPASNSWSPGPTRLRGDQSAEESWVKLPDGSILSYDMWASPASGPGHAQRYIPSTNTWVDAGSVPVPLSVAAEIGPAVLLPNGNAFQIGANGNTAIYNPATNSWVQGPSLPSGMGADDAAAAVLPSGHVLFAADTSSPIPYTGPTLLFDYDPVANTITQVTTPPLLSLTLGQAAFLERMLVLPNGDVLLTDSFNTIWEYTPDGAPSPSWLPTITSVVANGNGTYTLTGMQLNGLSEGAYYGDDAEMASNYPIVRFTDSSGHVFFGRTFNWSSTGVATGNTPETVQFTLPVGLAPGNYSLTVTATGISSASTPCTLLSNGVLVTGAASTTAISPNPAISIYGQLVTFTATVTDGLAPITTGTVTFEEGSTVLASNVPLDANGHASFSIATLSAAASPHVITALYSGGVTFPASTGNTSLTVNQRPVSITATPESKTYGDLDPALTYQITAGTLVPGDAVTGALTRAPGENVLPNLPGMTTGYAIQQGTLALGANYALTYVGANLTINPRSITVAADAQSKPFGAADPPLTYQITSGLLVLGDAFTGTLTRAAGESVGSYPIQQGSLALSGNYAMTFVAANLTVTPPSQLVITNLSSSSITAGATVSFTVTAEDSSGRVVPGYAGTIQLTSTDSNATVNGSPVPAKYTFVAGDAGTHTFTLLFKTAGAQSITVSDQVNTSLAATTKPITVTAIFTQYTVSVLGGTNLVAGNAFIFTVQATDSFGNPVTDYRGPATVTLAAAPIDFQSNVPATGTLDSNGFGFFLANLKTTGLYTLTATASSFTGASAKLTVAPAAAGYFKVSSPAATTTGTPVNVTVTALDPFGNTASSYSGLVHFTSSDPHATLPADTTLTGGQGVFNITLNTAGSQTITATDTLSFNPKITGMSTPINTRGLTVASLTPRSDGFTVTFSKPFIPADLTLYGAGLNIVQDVTLVGANVGPVPGSLIIDPTDTSLTFHATANGLSLLNNFDSVILPDDTYTVTLVSGAGGNGFMDALGTGLDGTDTGGHVNYRATFSTNYQEQATQVLSIPDFSRGPDAGHSIKVPNDTGHGIPVTLYNAAGITDVTFTLSYNPSLLSVSGGSSGDATDPTSSFTMVGNPTIIDATHATASFHFSSNNAKSGTVVLGDIVAVVPNTAAGIYKAKELLQLSSITVNHAAFTGVATSALHVNDYFGDLTGNGSIDALDVATAINVAEGKSTGFAAFPLVDPALVGDVALDYTVDAGDVSDLASFSVGSIFAVIPPIPARLVITPAGPDPTLSLAQQRMMDEGGRMNQSNDPTHPSSFILHPSISVVLDDPHPAGSSGMTEAVIALAYDPSVLSISPQDITLGSIPSENVGWQMTVSIDSATGQIGIVLYSTTAITTSAPGGLVNIAYHVLEGGPKARRRLMPRLAGAASVHLAGSVFLNGQEFTTQVDDAQGKLVLDQVFARLGAKTGVPDPA
jgi:hypothetical protein